MKKIKIIQIIELIILVIIAIGLIIFLSQVSRNSIGKGDGFSFRVDFDFSNGGDRATEIVKEEQVSSSGINKIKLDFDGADIEVSTTDEETIKIIERSSKPLEDKDLFTLVNQKGTLTVRREQKIPRIVFWGFMGQQHKIELSIPKNYEGDLELHTSSGDIWILNNLKLNQMMMSQASGNVNIKQLDCKAYSMDTASGDIDIDYLKGSGTIKTISGNVDIGELVGGTYNVHVTSGDIQVERITGSGEIKAVSGDIEVQYTGIEAYSNLTATSGDIDLTLANPISFQMGAKCISGDIEGNIDINYKNKKGNEATATVGAEPHAKLTVNTTSGDITINRNE